MARTFVCPSCGHSDFGTVFSPGSLMLEGLLWLLIIPGLLYHQWRRSKRRVICPKCSTEYDVS